MHKLILKTFKVIVFPEAMLSQTTIQQLMELTGRYDEWLLASMNEVEEMDLLYGQQFYHSVELER